MNTDSTRSEQVIEDYKKRKLARSALARIQDLIQGFEQDRRLDARLARIGIVVIVGLIGVALYFLFSGETIILN